MKTIRTMMAALALVASAQAWAANPPELGAEQIQTEVNDNTHVGANGYLRIAQVFELHDTGYLSHLMLPLSCPANAIVEVVIEEAPGGIPSGNVLAQQRVPGYVLDAVQSGNYGAAMRMIEFARPAALKPGRYAFIITVRGKDTCGLWRAPAGLTYPYYSYVMNSTAAGWQLHADPNGTPRMLAFQVFQRPL
ncbi:MAG: hypothetical protein QM612_11395 [Thermomonas sp.]|uniref:hypothetical protein n=1 Tax=Thermomonas sp. TaxID=1971895 RepID=UPI0039E6E1AC